MTAADKSSTGPADSIWEDLPDEVVHFEIDTTGYNPKEERIFEIAAVKTVGGSVVDEFLSLCDPGRSLPLSASRRTGLTRKDLADAPSPEEAVAEFMLFTEGCQLVSYDGDPASAFLIEATNGLFTGPVLCVSELARIVLPAAEGHRAETMCEHLGLAAPGARALDRARATAAVHAGLVTTLAGFDLALLNEVSWLLAKQKDPVAKLIQRVERVAVKRGFGKKVKGDFLELLPKDDSLRKRLSPESGGLAPQATLDAEAAASHLKATGSVAKTLSADYEERPEQVEMARQVASAFSEMRHLVVEAGTGVGKSLAYIVPAALWTHVSGRPVIVSTNTKNLQAQLYGKDLPLVERALERPIKTAMLKGRGNYLCARKLSYVLRNMDREIESRERSAMASVLVWAASTAGGDKADCTGLLSTPGGERLWEKLTSSGDECMSTSCRQAGRCFLRSARKKALNSDVVVANHALVFAELGLDTPVLPPYTEIVFDEAHNIESVATEHLGVKVNPPRVYRLLNTLWRKGRGRRGGRGLLATVHHQLGVLEGVNPDRLDEARLATKDAIDCIRPASDATGEFFDSVAPLVGRSDDKRRFGPELRPPDLWGPVLDKKKSFISNLAKLSRAIEQLIQTITDLGRAKLAYGGETKKELEARLSKISEIINDTDFVLTPKEENYVYWVESTGRGRARWHGICAAPIHIGRILCDQLYGIKHSVILTSATMTVGDSFDFISGRLGLDLLPEGRLKTIDVGTPFNFDKQAAVYVPEFLPDPGNEDAFCEDLSRLLVGLFSLTQGRGMALFTSYRMLDKVYHEVKEPLESERILVLGQGIDGSRERILEAFTREHESVLLGTSSFWEGVDVKGESLSALVIAKLPFQVFTDPIVKARCEQVEAAGQDSFMGYSVPTAILRLRQGFGRLIRSKTERGVVIICDKRLFTRRYGAEFCRSLPTEVEPAHDRGGMLREIEGFLEG